MVEKGTQVLGKFNFDEITQELKTNPQFRAAVIKHLAKEHAREYLGLVNLNAGLLHDVAARFVSSEKEWQE